MGDQNGAFPSNSSRLSFICGCVVLRPGLQTAILIRRDPSKAGNHFIPAGSGECLPVQPAGRLQRGQRARGKGRHTCHPATPRPSELRNRTRLRFPTESIASRCNRQPVSWLSDPLVRRPTRSDSSDWAAESRSPAGQVVQRARAGIPDLKFTHDRWTS
jgi:hypothetical protein